MNVADIERLTSVERLELVGRIWDTIDPSDYAVPEEHIWLLERCVSDYGALDENHEVKLAAQQLLDKLRLRAAPPT